MRERKMAPLTLTYGLYGAKLDLIQDRTKRKKKKKYNEHKSMTQQL